MLQIFNLGGAYIQQLQAGGEEVGTLQVDSNASVAGSESIGGSLGIGQSLDVSGNSAIGGTFNIVGQTTLGTSSSANGSIVFANSSNANTVTLVTGVSSATYSLILPTSAPTVGQCLEASSVTYNQLVFASCSTVNTSISEVNSWNSNGTNSTSSSSTLAVSPATSGDELVLTTEEVSTSNDAITSVSGGGVTSWHSVTGLNGNGTVGRVEMWIGTITSTGSSTVTVNYTTALSGTNSWEDAVTEFTASGVNAETGWGVDTKATQLNSTSSTTVTYPTLSPDSPEEVYIGYADSQYTGTAGSYGSFSYLITSASNIITYYSPGAVGTSYTPTATQSTSGQSNTVGAILVAFVNSTAINNSTSLQQGNFNVQAAGNSSVAGVLEAGSSSPGDILDLENNSGINVASFGSTGNVLFQASNSVSAFQVENASNVSLLTVDTFNSIVTLGNSSSQVILGSVTNGATIASTTGLLTYNGNARHTKYLTLTPEYAGATLSNNVWSGLGDIGTMTAGFDTTRTENYYQWSTSQSTNQAYDIVVSIPVPTDFSAWSSTTPITVDVKTSDTTNGIINAKLYDTNKTIETSWNLCSLTPGSTNTWTTVTGCAVSGTYSNSGGKYMTLIIQLQSPTNGTTQIGNINLSYLSSF
jgi:hypothetical protein